MVITNPPISPDYKPRRRQPLIRGIAQAQKILLYSIIAMVIGRGLATVLLLSQPEAVGPAVLYLLVFLATLILGLYAVFNVSRALQYSIGVSVLCIVAMFLPLVNLICLLVLNGKATRELRAVGVPVGLFGADMSYVKP